MNRARWKEYGPGVRFRIRGGEEEAGVRKRIKINRMRILTRRKKTKKTSRMVEDNGVRWLDDGMTKCWDGEMTRWQDGWMTRWRDDKMAR